MLSNPVSIELWVCNPLFIGYFRASFVSSSTKVRVIQQTSKLRTRASLSWVHFQLLEILRNSTLLDFI